MAALDRIPNFAHARLACTAFGRLQTEPGPASPLLRRPIAVGTIGLRVWQAPLFWDGDALLCQRRLHHSAL